MIDRRTIEGRIEALEQQKAATIARARDQIGQIDGACSVLRQLLAEEDAEARGLATELANGRCVESE